MVLAAASLWGVSGTAAQYLMQDAGLSPAWLATVRMAVAGVLLLSLAAARHGPRSIGAPWRSAPDALRLVAFAVLGLFLVQYSYLAAIAAANAATATVLQYSGSGLVVIWAALGARRPPPARHLAALAIAAAGIALLVTNGSPTHLALPAAGLAWGVVSAASLALYTILPQPLLHRFGTLPVVGWGMVVGAASAGALLHPALPAPALGHPGDLLLVAFVLILGTCVPFTLYLASMRRLPASEAALLANAEPVAAAVAAVLWLDVRLGVWAAGGAALVLAATTDLFRSAGSRPGCVPAAVTAAATATAGTQPKA